MRITRLLIRFLFVVFFGWPASSSAQIPNPKSALGFEIGEDRKLADWQQVLDYFQKIAATAPERVKYEEVGKTTLGKPFVALTISSPENISKLEHFRQIQQRLADPRGLRKDEAEELIRQGKAVVLITCTVHSDEVASTQTAMEYVYKLLTEDTPDHRAILDNVILVLIPSLNPDGQDMVVKWYRKYVGTPFEGAYPVELYQPYVGHDDNRDWYMFTQVESRLAVGKIQNVWHPQVLYDVHQMDQNTARLFVPPFLDPIDPNIDPLLTQETNWLGTSVAAALATAGKKGIAIQAIYDEWSPSRHYSAYHGGLRILTESASAQLASPVKIPFSVLETHALGYNAQQSSWNFPDPWLGGEWRLRDIVDYQLIAFNTVLLTVAQNSKTFIRNFYQVGMNAVEWKGHPFAFVVPPKQKDMPAAIKMLNTLQLGQVEIFRAKERFTADDTEYPAGTFVIPIAQPYGHYAKTLLERQRYPDLRESPGGPPKRPYDTTAQTLPLLMGVRTAEILAPFSAALEKVGPIELPPSQVKKKANQYLLRSESNNAFLAVNRLLKAGETVERTKKPTGCAGQIFPAGTFIIKSSKIESLSSLGLDFYGCDGLIAESVPLREPRVALYKSYIPNIDEGWTRWLLEQFEFSYTNVHDKEIRDGMLNTNFDVLIIPHQSTLAIVDGIPATPRMEGQTLAPEISLPAGLPPIVEPPEFTGGIGKTGIENLRKFAIQGGEIITLNRASDLAIEKLNVGARNILQTIPSKEFYGPGSIVSVTVDTEHPLGFGMDRETAVWFERGSAFVPSYLSADTPAATVVASYPGGDPLMSGWLLGGAMLENRGALVDAPLGRGNVVMFGFRPQYRGQSYATFKMLFNALFYFEMR